MPARRNRPRSGSKSTGGPAPKQPTDVLTGEPGRFDLGGGEGSLRIRTPFEPLREATDKAIDQRLTELDEGRAAKEREVVERQREHIDLAFKAVQGIEDLKTREDILDGFGGLLGLGLFHPGSSDVKDDVMAEQRKAGTEGARKALDARPNRQLAAKVSSILQDLAFQLWDTDREINGRYQFRRRYTATANALFLQLSFEIKKFVPLNSIYYPPISNDGKSYENYRGTLLNYVRKASKIYERKRST